MSLLGLLLLLFAGDAWGLSVESSPRDDDAMVDEEQQQLRRALLFLHAFRQRRFVLSGLFN